VLDSCDIANLTSPDCNTNGIPDECETDCNANGVPDDCDISSGTSLDCNVDGVPDDCQLTGNDCNANTIPDDCELAGNDCNSNGVLDSCDIANLTSPDCNSNGLPDECELTGNDCNANGVPDSCDIANLTSADCNLNGTPDECETDCNGNGVPDDCDLSAGTSLDCNADSIPDDCQLTGNDCNTDGIPDDCQLTGNDCNTNGVPDDCDLSSGTSQDCNTDSIPDDCQLAGNDCNSNSVPDDCELFPPITYVDDSAPAGGDGASWATAFNDLRDAMSIAPCTVVTEIRVGGGTYKPGTARTDYFRLTANTRVVGGYAGFGAPDPNLRDTVAYETVLSGDIGVVGDKTDNCYRVVGGDGVGATAVLEGVTVTGGNANGAAPYNNGGGIFVSSGSPTLISLKVQGNASTTSGGGIYNSSGTPAVTNCSFVGNTAGTGGGGMYNGSGSATITNCTFANNVSGQGAGMFNLSASPTIVNSIFWGNSTATGAASEMLNFFGAAPTISYSAIRGGLPSGAINGGGNTAADPLFLQAPNPGVDATWGTPDDYYGNLALQNGSPCVDAGNNSAVPAGLTKDLSWHPRFSDDPLTPDTGLGTPPIVDMGAYEVFPDCNGNGISDADDIANLTSADCNSNGIPDECELAGNDCNNNSIPDDCDVAVLDCNGSGIPDDCELVGNDCNSNGIPDTCENDCNCNGIDDLTDIANLTSSDCNGNSTPDECEIDVNSTAPGGPFFCTSNCAADCNNNGVPDSCDISSAVSNDCDTNGTPDECQIDVNSTAPGGPFFCTSNCDADCNNTGVPDACELSGNDCNGSGVPDECELPGNDCNANSVLDVCDIASLTSNDCDTNGTPDECQIDVNSPAPGGPFFCTSNCDADCNNTGIPDVCELPGNDCNGTGVPDECELTNNDCNTNSVPDECDISSLTSADCNTDGTPDECEIDVNSTAPGGPFFCTVNCDVDCNNNGVPDVCDAVGHDCNANNVPDTCEIDLNSTAPGGPFFCTVNCDPDCNNNGVLDICDAVGHDCNTNDVPDYCEIDVNSTAPGGPFFCTANCDADCNNNGVPDSCDAISPILYVDQHAPAGGDGQTWGWAFQTIAQAAAGTACQQVVEIRVAQGTYKPGTGRGDSFHLVPGVRIRGGYVGLLGYPQGLLPDTRDIEAYETILSGDVGVAGVATDNTYHVVDASGMDATAVLEGVTIADGYADGSPPLSFGAGMYIDGGSPTIIACTFRRNKVTRTGGGMYVRQGSPTVLNSTFVGNSADFDGAAIRNETSTTAITNCTFVGNHADFDGGAIYNVGADPVVTNCSFTENRSGRGGGAMYSTQGGLATMVNCAVWNNWPTEVVVNGAQTTISSSAIRNGVPVGVTDGGGNIDADPKFEVTPSPGGDGTWGTADDDYGDLRIKSISQLIDVGDTAALPADVADLDGDGNTTEPLPVDRDGSVRVHDGDANGSAEVDMGAYEFQGLVQLAPDPLIGTGEAATPSRYLRFSAPAGVSSSAEVVRVRMVSLNGFPVPNPDVLYVGPPSTAPEEDSSDPTRTVRVAPLQCETYVHDWTSEGIVSAYGAEIIPGSVYELQRSSASCPNLASDVDCWSVPLVITAGKYGDATGPFEGEDPSAPQPDFNDIASIVNKFLALPGAPIKPVAQLQPNIVFPDRAINFKDIAVAVDAFLGVPFNQMYSGPCTCPSGIVCGATSCSGDAVCGTGFCIGGFCRDECGRCAP